MDGQPCIRGLRITVKRVLEILGSYPERAELFGDYPDLTEADIQQALQFASSHIDGQIRDEAITPKDIQILVPDASSWYASPNSASMFICRIRFC